VNKYQRISLTIASIAALISLVKLTTDILSKQNKNYQTNVNKFVNHSQIQQAGPGSVQTINYFPSPQKIETMPSKLNNADVIRYSKADIDNDLILECDENIAYINDNIGKLTTEINNIKSNGKSLAPPQLLNVDTWSRVKRSAKYIYDANKFNRCFEVYQSIFEINNLMKEREKLIAKADFALVEDVFKTDTLLLKLSSDAKVRLISQRKKLED
jgi:hypothetical protein